VKNSSAGIQWRRSTRCDSGDCVEVARAGETVMLRDSKVDNGHVLTFGLSEWKAFVEGVTAGDFDPR
jgi:hypothetical protein